MKLEYPSYMRYLFLIAIALFSFSVLAQTDQTERLLTVNCVGAHEFAPDIIIADFTFTMNQQNPPALETFEAQVADFFDDLKIKDRVVVKQNLLVPANANPNGYYNNVARYITYSLTLKDFEEFDALQAQSQRLNSNCMHLKFALSFVGISVAVAEEARISGFEKALLQAHTKAELVAKQLGANVGAVLKVQEAGNGYTINSQTNYVSGYAASPKRSSDYRIPLTVSLNVYYQLDE